METTRAPQPHIHEAIHCLGRLADAFHTRREQLAAAVGLTDQQWEVLEEIATEHFMPSMFARRRQSSAAAVSKTLRQLADRGLVSASVGRQDARRRRYRLTGDGERTIGHLREERQRAIERVWSDLDAGELAAFVRFGERLADRLKQYTESVSRPHEPERTGSGRN